MALWSPTRPSISMPLAELVDLEKEKARMAEGAEKEPAPSWTSSTPSWPEPRLPGNKAPENVVKAEQERAEKLAALIAQLQEQAASL